LHRNGKKQNLTPAGGKGRGGEKKIYFYPLPPAGPPAVYPGGKYCGAATWKFVPVPQA